LGALSHEENLIFYLFKEGEQGVFSAPTEQKKLNLLLIGLFFIPK